MQRFQYSVLLTAADEGGYVVTCRDLPPLVTQGENEQDALTQAAETVAKAALYVAMREAGISKLQLAKQLGVDEKEVRRLLDPHYGSKLPRIAEAISLLGQRLVIGLEPG